MIITICNHKEFFYPLLVESIKGTYGFPRMDPDEYQRLYDEGLLTDAQVDDHNTPGPYSFLGYLRALQKPDFWGDELCLCLLSMCFQIGITVINAETLQGSGLDTRKTSRTSTWCCAIARVITMSQPVSTTFVVFDGSFCTLMGVCALRWVTDVLRWIPLCCNHCIWMDVFALKWI